VPVSKQTRSSNEEETPMNVKKQKLLRESTMSVKTGIRAGVFLNKKI
jgi:hypothetical protein